MSNNRKIIELRNIKLVDYTYINVNLPSFYNTFHDNLNIDKLIDSQWNYNVYRIGKHVYNYHIRIDDLTFLKNTYYFSKSTYGINRYTIREDITIKMNRKLYNLMFLKEDTNMNEYNLYLLPQEEYLERILSL